MDWLTFFGRFHVLALHLPIGILSLAAIAEIYYARKSEKERPDFLRAIWLWGTLSAAIAAGLGYLLSLSGGYDETTLERHLITGIATGVVGFLCWLVFGLIKVRRAVAVYTLAGLQLLLMGITGHLGGNLTHGPEYLFEHAPNPVRKLAGFGPRRIARPAVTDLNQADVFLDVAQPLLELRCTSCHNPSKTKGGLLLDSYENIMLGGDTGAAVVPGDLIASELSIRINLDPEHDDFMPSGGKTPFTEAQTRVMDWWIEIGAPAGGTIASFAPSPEVSAWIAAALDQPTPAVSLTNELGLPKLPALSRDVLMELESLGFDATPISETATHLDIDFYRIGSETITDEHVQALLKARDHIAWLNLGNSGLTDAQLETIGQLPNLLKLDVSNNPVTDTGITALTPLPRLQTLNLHHTKITDNALPVLDQLITLEQANVWATSVTPESAATRPYAEIATGFSVPERDGSSK